MIVPPLAVIARLMSRSLRGRRILLAPAWTTVLWLISLFLCGLVHLGSLQVIRLGILHGIEVEAPDKQNQV